MYLSRISLANFRNIAAAELDPGHSVTILHGLNGQGKTNLLESIHILGHARPFRPAKTSELILHEEKQALIKGEVVSRKVRGEIVVQLEGANRRVRIDGKTIQRSSELHGRLAVVLFSPDDTSMVKLGPETRRRYLDRVSYAAEISFLKDYHDYYRTLKQRNHLLKSGKTETLDIWTEQLAEAGTRLIRQRRDFAARLNLKLCKQYQNIAGTSEKVALSYSPDSGETEETFERLFKLLNDNIQTDLRYGTTGRGPHRDDLLFLIDGRQLKTFGSQGQQRSFVLALKMAELDALQETFGEPPVLLLDDMSSELDRQRSSNLLAFVRERGIQSFITTTEITALPENILKESVCYRVEGGRLTYEGKATR